MLLELVTYPDARVLVLHPKGNARIDDHATVAGALDWIAATTTQYANSFPTSQFFAQLSEHKALSNNILPPSTPPSGGPPFSVE
jgi:hypothetical protein